jgi:hypothetical protein
LGRLAGQAHGPGYLSFSARNPSTEGLDKITSIRYYARMRLVVNLLPLLCAAPSLRVISVLAGGKEGQLWPDDFLLGKHYSIGNAAGASASMTTLFMEELAKQEPKSKIVFVHVFPGLVTDTNLFRTEHFGTLMKFVLRPQQGLLGSYLTGWQSSSRGGTECRWKDLQVERDIQVKSGTEDDLIHVEFIFEHIKLSH